MVYKRPVIWFPLGLLNAKGIGGGGEVCGSPFQEVTSIECKDAFMWLEGRRIKFKL